MQANLLLTLALPPVVLAVCHLTLPEVIVTCPLLALQIVIVLANLLLTLPPVIVASHFGPGYNQFKRNIS